MLIEEIKQNDTKYSKPEKVKKKSFKRVDYKQKKRERMRAMNGKQLQIQQQLIQIYQ